jgi:uncharacterized protein with HEPN domain
LQYEGGIVVKMFIDINSKNKQIILHMRRYCEEIIASIDRFGKDYDVFINDRVYFNAVSMCLLQIGELSLNLTESFVDITSEYIIWEEVRNIRDMLLLPYTEVDIDLIWKTTVVYATIFYQFCDMILTGNLEE